jgi:hypothetical protein
VLLVDGGDLAHPNLKHEERYNQFVLRAMGSMSYDAMTLGELELYRGRDYVQSLLDSTRVPIALANARFAESGKPLGERYILRKVGEVTYGIVGLLGQQFEDGRGKPREQARVDGVAKFKNAGFAVDDPFEVAATLVPEVDKLAEVVVVLAHLPTDEARELAKAVPGIDVLVLGHQLHAQPPAQLETTTQTPGAEAGENYVKSLGPVVVTPGQQGQHLAQTRLSLAADRRILAYGGAATPLTLRDFPERMDLAEALKKLHQVVNSERKRLELASDISLGEKRLVAGQDHFLGDLRCARCHFDIYQDWRNTQHAHAWQTLVELNRDADPECVSCHVTGMDLPGGYKGVGAIQDMRNVQCEACHGMGTMHDMTGATDPEAGNATCIRCHSGENSPEFEFDRYWPKIMH